jgi:hypothetical protein
MEIYWIVGGKFIGMLGRKFARMLERRLESDLKMHLHEKSFEFCEDKLKVL